MLFEFLGFGGAFDFEFGNSSALIRQQDKVILLDCGHSVYPILRHHELVDELTHVLITHLHDDHCGSLSTLLFHRHFAPDTQPLTLLYPDEAFKKELLAFLKHTMARPEEYFSLEPLEGFDLIEAIDLKGKHVPDMLNYGYIFRPEGEEAVVFSSDLGDIHYLIAELHKRGLMGITVFQDVAFGQYPAHAYYKEVEKYMDQYNIIGYHHDPRNKPEDCQLKLVAELPEYLYGRH